jgi:hypothetical protein
MEETTATGQAPETVSVFGSCVTRDNFNSVFNPGYKEWFEVGPSANQSSVIALMSPPIEESFIALEEMSEYDEWNIRSDLNRHFLTDVAEVQPDHLVLDFFGDVHFGVARLADGRHLTDNRWKTHLTDFYERHRDAGDLTVIHWVDDPDAYLALWTEALDSFAAYLARTCPRTRVIVHRGYNTNRVLVPEQPRPAPLDAYMRLAPLDVPALNAFWARLDDYAIQTHGWDAIDLRDLGAPSYLEHPWGAFYVHYTPDYYHRFMAEMHKISLRPRVDDATWRRLELIEAAAREPAERRLGVARSTAATERARRQRSWDRVAELESLSLAGGLRYALGKRMRSRRGDGER